jgi:hypothetical protein
VTRALIGLAMLAVACGREPPPSSSPSPRPPEEKPVAPNDPTTELMISQQWEGVIRIEDTAGDAVTGLVIRDDAAYDAFIARLPEKRVQKRQPAPPSDDPMLARPAIDFATDMLVVVMRRDTLDSPGLARIVLDGGRVVVTHASPPPAPAAMPHGIGGYTAARVPRADGELALATPPLIEDEAAVAAAAGTLVTLRGDLSRTKIPTLLGVDVDPGSADGGDRVEATGWLEVTEVTQAELDAKIAEVGQFAHRGPGTFRRLVAPDRNGLARSHRVY